MKKETPQMEPRSSYRRRLFWLTVCMAFQATGISLLFTVFARKINSFSGGVAVFGLSATVHSLAALISAPVMGGLADRFGRRALLLVSLTASGLASLGYLVVPGATEFILVRTVSGGLTAGLVPATISMIGDLCPEEERGRWIGFVNGWSTVGYIIGPPLGGWIYDFWGLRGPFLVAAVAHLMALLIAMLFISQSRVRIEPRGTLLPFGLASDGKDLSRKSRLKIRFPFYSHSLLILGLISFIAVFAWRFVEPQFHFYIYDILEWTSSRFGLVMSGYAVLMLVAETTLGSFSDRIGRKPVLMVGLVIHTAQYVALIATKSVAWITLGIALSGLGEGLFMPVLNASFLDITPERYRGRVIGFKESMFSLGGLLGPALLVIAVKAMTPGVIFILSGSLIMLSSLLVPLLFLEKKSYVEKNPGFISKSE